MAWTIDMETARKWGWKAAIGAGVLVGLIVLALVAKPIAHALFRHRASHGTVLAINYEPAHERHYMQPIPHTDCHPVTTGKTTTTQCTTSYTYVPMTEHVPDAWSARVKDETGTEDWVGVSESVYGTCQVGMFYPGDGQVCTGG